MESAAKDGADILHDKVNGGTPERILNLASYFILVLGIGTVAAAAYLMLAAYTTVPYWDEWAILSPSAGWNANLPLQWIWAQNNEHRIVFHKLLLLLDLHLFKGREWPMFLATFLSQLSLFALLAYLLRKIGRLEGWAYRFAIGIALYCVFCPSQWENFNWGFQLPFVFVNLLFAAALTALLLFAQAAEMRSRRRNLFAISILAAAAATICNANGLLVWLVLVVASLVLRLRWLVTTIYALSGVLLGILYFRGYVPPPQHASPWASLQQPLQILEYVEKYFGNSFLPSPHVDWSIQVGVAGLLAVLGLSFFVSRQLEKPDKLFRIGLLSIMGYTFLTACITALGRVNFGTDQAYASRYQSYALLFWFAFVLLLMTLLLTLKRTKALAVLSVAIVALFATSVLWYGPLLQRLEDTRSQRELAGMSLLTGVHDDDLVKGTIWIYPPMVWDDAAYFKQHGLSIFSTEEARRLNQPFAAIYKVVPSDRCFGFIDLVQSFKETSGGLKLEGWAVHRKSNRPLSGMVMVNDGLIRGYGVPGFPRGDVADNLRSDRAMYSGWKGFVEPAGQGNITEVYGIINSFGHHKVCKIGQVMSPGT